jgi:hypothetical protein
MGHDHSFEAVIAIRALQGVDGHDLSFDAQGRYGPWASWYANRPGDQAALRLRISSRTSFAPSTMAWSLSLAM